MSVDDLELQACQLKQGQYIPDGAVKAVKATPLSSMKVRRAKSLVSVYKLLGTKLQVDILCQKTRWKDSSCQKSEVTIAELVC